MLLLPLEEDSLLFRACLLYGIAVLVLEVLMPLLFQCRVRIVIPELHLPPAQVLTASAFQRQTQQLKDEIRALQQAPRTPKSAKRTARARILRDEATGVVSSRRKRMSARPRLEEDTEKKPLFRSMSSRRGDRKQAFERQQSERGPLFLRSRPLEVVRATRSAGKSSRHQEVSTSSIFIEENHQQPMSNAGRSTSNMTRTAIPRVADLDQRMRSSLGLSKPPVVQAAAKSKLKTPKSILKQPKRTRDADDSQPERSQIKTPKIARRIAFDEELQALTSPPIHEQSRSRSSGKRKRVARTELQNANFAVRKRTTYGQDRFMRLRAPSDTDIETITQL